MKTDTSLQAILRAAFGPGFQAGGPSERTLQVITRRLRCAPSA